MASGMNDTRLRVLGLLEKFGWNSMSFQILEPGFHYWFDGDACIGYVDTGSAWVAAGAPIAPVERFAELADKFVAAATEEGRRVCFFGTEQRFAAATGWSALQVGDQPVWAPDDWAGVVKERKSLREQLRRAKAKGVVVRVVEPCELAVGQPIRVQIDAVIRRWLASRSIAPMGFLVQVDPFTFPAERRYFVAEHAGRVVGFLAIIPIYARHGWFFEDFLRDPDAPNGTIELLIDAGMRAAVEAGIPHVTLGMVPLSGDVNLWLRVARRLSRQLYDFDGLRAFKAKLQPRTWDPIYLAYPKGRGSAGAMLDTLTAFSRGGLLRFGVETLLRGPAIVVRALAILLVAWTVVLALPATERWFPSPVWQYGWVAFDIVLAGALFVLTQRWRGWLGDVVATAVTVDALATLIEAIAYNLPHRQGPLDVVVVVVAVAAPTIAALMLWNARARSS